MWTNWVIAIGMVLYGTSCTSVQARRGFNCPPHYRATAESQIATDKTALAAVTHEVDKTDNFDLHVIEFAENGTLQHPAALDHAVRCIEEASIPRSRRSGQCPIRPTETQGVLLLVFIHGWLNDASVCNENMNCFRESLRLVAKLEREVFNPGRTPRHVVGVYIGWRGYVWPPVEGLKRTDVISRKRVAERIGRTGLGRVLDRLEDVRLGAISAEEWGERAPSLMLTVAHSFGALMLTNAMKIEGADPAPSGRPRVKMKVRGDTVFLLNSAGEAAPFSLLGPESINPTLDVRIPKQMPRLLTITSESDWATKYGYPVAGFLNWLVRGRFRYGFLNSVKAVGHRGPLRTHELRLEATRSEGGDWYLEPPAQGPKPECACAVQFKTGDPVLERYSWVNTEIDLTIDQNFGPRGPAYIELEPRAGYKGGPVLHIRAKKNLMNGHGDIFNGNLFVFLSDLITGFISNH